MSGHAGAEARARNPRFALLDSLRAIAALSVFVFHLAFQLQWFHHDVVTPYITNLSVGVPIFFMISGFLLYRPYAEARLTGRGGPELVPYGARRLLRILPAYWVALTVIALWLGLSDVFTPRGIATYYPLGQIYDTNTTKGGIQQAWTVCVELSFYALLPAWAWLVRRVPVNGMRGFLRTEALLLGGLFSLAVVWKIATANLAPAFGHPFHSAVVVLPAWIDNFALGMGLAVASIAVAHGGAGRRARATVDAIRRRSWLPWLLAAGIYVILAHRWGPLGAGGWQEYVGRSELQGFVAMLLLLPAVFDDGQRLGVRRLLSNRVLLWVGVTSYGFYLWHWAVITKLREAGAEDALTDVGFTVAALAGTAALGAASWYGLERYAVGFGRRLTRRSGDLPAGPLRPGEGIDPVAEAEPAEPAEPASVR